MKLTKKTQNKKAQGMSMKVIIVAVIALIVLVVLVLIFTGRSKLFTKGTSNTANAYSTDKCKIPGTGRMCSDSKSDCDIKGGVYDDNDGVGYGDCFDRGCCSV